jgi:hypothetical protein
MRYIITTVLAAVLLIGLPGVLSAQAQACLVAIKAPTGEEPVGAQGDVTVTAQIPRNAYVWLLARRDDQPKNFLWPQQGIAAADLVQQSGGPPKFEASVHYGEPSDTNKNFRVIAIVVDADQSQKLENWREEAPTKGYRPWIGLPRSVEGCTPAQVVVKKVEP